MVYETKGAISGGACENISSPGAKSDSEPDLVLRRENRFRCGLQVWVGAKRGPLGGFENPRGVGGSEQMAVFGDEASRKVSTEKANGQGRHGNAALTSRSQITAAHGHCLGVALGTKFWFLSPMKMPRPSFGIVDARLEPLGFMGNIPVFLHLGGQMRDESQMRTFILDLCFQKPKLFSVGSERREGRKLG